MIMNMQKVESEPPKTRAKKQKSKEGLRVEISKSIIVPSRTDDEGSDVDKSGTMHAGPASGGELSPCAPMSLAQNTLD